MIHVPTRLTNTACQSVPPPARLDQYGSSQYFTDKHSTPLGIMQRPLYVQVDLLALQRYLDMAGPIMLDGTGHFGRRWQGNKRRSCWCLCLRFAYPAMKHVVINIVCPGNGRHGGGRVLAQGNQMGLECWAVNPPTGLSCRFCTRCLC